MIANSVRLARQRAKATRDYGKDSPQVAALDRAWRRAKIAEAV
jgi:hypothetical protein